VLKNGHLIFRLSVTFINFIVEIQCCGYHGGVRTGVTWT